MDDKPLLVQISNTRAIIANASKWMMLFPDDKDHESGIISFTTKTKELDGFTFQRTGVVLDFPDDGSMAMFCLKYL